MARQQQRHGKPSKPSFARIFNILESDDSIQCFFNRLDDCLRKLPALLCNFTKVELQQFGYWLERQLIEQTTLDVELYGVDNVWLADQRALKIVVEQHDGPDGDEFIGEVGCWLYYTLILNFPSKDGRSCNLPICAQHKEYLISSYLLVEYLLP